MQSVEAPLPVVSRYLPAAQSMHPVLPVASTYLPAAQLMQAVEAPLPVVSRYLPTPQRVHPVGREIPSPLHIPAVTVPRVPAGQSTPFEQAIQASAEVDPTASEYLPYPHALQVVAACA